MKIFAYYLAIVMLILFVGSVIVRLWFAPCTMIGNYCVGDGWTIAGLAATIPGISATVLGILGAFALAAWWTDLDKRVQKQVEASLNQREEILNKRMDDIFATLEANYSEKVQDLLTRFSERINQSFSEQQQVLTIVTNQIERLRDEYMKINKMAEDTTKIAVDVAMSGTPWGIESRAYDAVEDYHIIYVPVLMVRKYLDVIDDFLTTDPLENAEYVSYLKAKGYPHDIAQLWQAVLRWQEEVNKFSSKHPETVKQINDQVESYSKRIDELRRNATL